MLPKLIRRVWEKKISRFFAVGCFNTTLDFLTFNVLSLVFNIPTAVAVALSVMVGITASYFLNHRIVFRHPHNPSLKSYGKFLLVTGFSTIVIQELIVSFLAPRLIHLQPGQATIVMGHAVASLTLLQNGAKLVAVGVGMVWNYLLYKYVVFAHNPEAAKEEEVLIA